MGILELMQVAMFLAVAAFMAPLARRMKLGAVLGYLLGGVLIAQASHLIAPLLPGFKPPDSKALLHTAEIGVALFLFIIGLELKPSRLWGLRYSVFVVGGVQVALTAITLTAIGFSLDYAFALWFLVGLAVSLSSTAFALQILEEKGELQSRHGRTAFSILLFQDMAAIPIIALVPVFELGGELSGQGTALAAAQALGAVALLIVIGRFVLNRLYALVARTGMREAMTASALLTVVGAIALMTSFGMSPVLGAFVAGVLLADSEYRHQLASDIEPFEALLLGVFFTAIGMTLNFSVVFTEPLLILIGVVGLVTIKIGIIYAIGLWQGLESWAARRLAIVLSQGGEFAFVIFDSALKKNVLDKANTELLTVIVTLSMATTPLLMLLDDRFGGRRRDAPQPYDDLPKNEGHVVIAGFGRFGQIVARVLRAKRIPFTALDISAEQVNFVNQFGNKIYYGDASRLSILEAAETSKARAFVLAIDNIEASVLTAQVVRRYFPHVPVYARARDRQHVHRLMDLGIEYIERETYLSALELTRDVLRGLGLKEAEVRYVVDTFKEHDERRLYDDYKHYTDFEKIASLARKQSEELEQLFAQDFQAPDKVEPKPAKSETGVKARPRDGASQSGAAPMSQPQKSSETAPAE